MLQVSALPPWRPTKQLEQQLEQQQLEQLEIRRLGPAAKVLLPAVAGDTAVTTRLAQARTSRAALTTRQQLQVGAVCSVLCGCVLCVVCSSTDPCALHIQVFDASKWGRVLQTIGETLRHADQLRQAAIAQDELQRWRRWRGCWQGEVMAPARQGPLAVGAHVLIQFEEHVSIPLHP